MTSNQLFPDLHPYKAKDSYNDSSKKTKIPSYGSSYSKGLPYGIIALLTPLTGLPHDLLAKGM